MERHEERQLIQKAQAGDARAYAQLVETHAPFVYNLALRLLSVPQEADDLAQEAFLRAWQSLPSFRIEARFQTWLYRIVTNLCYNRLPHLKQELAALDPEEDVVLPAKRPSPERQLVNVELRADLHRAINDLPENYRLLIVLRHLQGMAYEEIAAVTDMPLGTVKTGIYRARQQLRLALAAHHKESPHD